MKLQIQKRKKKEVRWRKRVLFVSQSLNCPEFRGLTPSEATLKKIIYPLPVPRGSLDKRILSLRMCRGNSAQSFLLYGQFPHLRAASLLENLIWLRVQSRMNPSPRGSFTFFSILRSIWSLCSEIFPRYTQSYCIYCLTLAAVKAQLVLCGSWKECNSEIHLMSKTISIMLLIASRCYDIDSGQECLRLLQWTDGYLLVNWNCSLKSNLTDEECLLVNHDVLNEV